MKKKPVIFIKHILECIEIIENYTKGVKEKDFDDNLQLQDAVIRRLEIIGEVIKNLPNSVKVQYPTVAWKKIAGMRDILIHHYFGVSLKTTWGIVKTDIGPLKKQMMKIKKDLE